MKIIILLALFSSFSFADSLECKKLGLREGRPDLLCGQVINLKNGNIKINNISYGEYKVKPKKYSQDKICELFVNSASRPVEITAKRTNENFDIEYCERSLFKTKLKIVTYLDSVICN